MTTPRYTLPKAPRPMQAFKSTRYAPMTLYLVEFEVEEEEVSALPSRCEGALESSGGSDSIRRFSSEVLRYTFLRVVSDVVGVGV
mmetsp:Transcript_27785/g.32059  ORF Transcript_27785/g.32059 Transcript_27785/m.32059 type:complete len:85 (+) Transcript_27785:2013-2267(+)